MVHWLRVHFGNRVTVGEALDDGRVTVDIGFPERHEDPARELCAYGEALEVLSPADVRTRLAEIGTTLVRRYATVH